MSNSEVQISEILDGDLNDLRINPNQIKNLIYQYADISHSVEDLSQDIQTDKKKSFRNTIIHDVIELLVAGVMLTLIILKK